MAKASNFALEIVEDSEPEREELRRAMKEERRKKRQIKRSVERQNKAEVIEITDGESVASGGSVIGVFDEPGKTRVSSTPSSSVEVLSAVLNPSFILESSVTHAEPAPRNTTLALEVSLPRPVLPSTTRRSNDLPILHNPESEGVNLETNTLNLTRFAYKDMTSRPEPKAVPSRQPSVISLKTTNSEGDAAPKGKKKPTRPNHRFTSDFTDTELVKLLKCVSCDLHWTVRKTVAQKMVHIQSCAKKNGLTDDTVRIAIRKAVANAPVVDSKGKGKAKAKNDEPEETLTKTLYEDIVDKAAPKKNGRAAKVVETVVSATAARDSILDRARAVLDLGSKPGIIPITDDAYKGFTIRTQASGAYQPGKFDSTEVVLPVATQAFGRSALASRHASKSTVVVSSAGLPPATQAFAQSALGSRYQSRLDPPARPIISDSDAEDSDVEMVPSTQGTAPSNLALARPSKRPAKNVSSPPSSVLSPSGVLNRLNSQGLSPLQGFSLRSPLFVDLVTSSESEENGPSQYHPMRMSQSSSDDSFQVLEVSRISSSTPLTSGHVQLERRGTEDNTGNDIDTSSEYDVSDREVYLHFDPELENATQNNLTPVMDHSGSASLMNVDTATKVKKPRRKKASSITAESTDDNPFLVTYIPTPTETIAKPKKVRNRTAAPTTSSSDTDSDLPLMNKTSPSKKSAKAKGKEREKDKKPAATPKKTKNTKSIAELKSETEAIWEESVTQKLRQNTDLYLRILRFEPIHFDEFLALVANDLGSKRRLCSLLDKLSINYYAVTKTPRKRRRRRSKRA